MQIQWYPGHMNKASKQIKEALPGVDILIEVLDARIPFSSENPMLAELRGDKPCIKVLSKTDLADPEITAQWQQYLEQKQGVKTLAIRTDQPEKALQLTDLCRKMMPHKAKNEKTIHTMIVGIPNVGKSTLINTLAGRTIAKTGNEPAVTKTQQRIKLDYGITLSDTPGVMWPNVENKGSGYRLATTGAIRDTAMDYIDVAFFAVDFMAKTYPERLKARYELDQIAPSALEILEDIGSKRGCLRSGGQVDLDRVSKIFITELRSGVLGLITLETPAMMEVEKANLVIIRAEKAAKLELKKTTRKKSWKASR
jgi:ribosome biogenesis GTPase A